LKLLSLSVLILLFNPYESTAQESSKSEKTHTVSIGYPAFIFDTPDLGIYVGYNLEMIKKNRFSWEFHTSFSSSFFDKDDGTFSHNGGSTYVGSILFGPRVYLMKPEKSTRIYMNFMPGIAFIQDSEYRSPSSGVDFLATENNTAFCFSIGAYLQFQNKFIVGTAFEQYGSLVFKAGYKM